MTKPQYSRRYGRSVNLLPVGLTVICVITAAFGDAARFWLRYERAGLLDGEWWRIVTGHLVHLGPTHTLLNLAGFGLLLWLFIAEIRPWEWVAAGLVSAASIALGLFFWGPETDWYVGLSGVLHGWFAIGAARTCAKQARFGLAMLLGLAAKLIWEQLRGTMPFTLALDIGPVVVDAHLYGALGGALFYVISRLGMLVGRSGSPL